MELTRDSLLHIERMSADPEKRELASALIAEMNKPKVWDKAPDIAVRAIVQFVDFNARSCGDKNYTRTLPKSTEREIAEKWADKFSNTGKAIEIIESAINEYKESVK